MRMSVRQAIAYLLVSAFVATGVSRAAVSAVLTHNPIAQSNHDVDGGGHGHHRHAMDSEDVGSWGCLKYCVEHAPDTGMITVASALDAAPSEQFVQVHGSKFQNNLTNLESATTVWPRGPPQSAHGFVPRKRHDILLQTARLRI